MPLDQNRPFLVGEWTVEPELNALRRGGVEKRVEPKVMQVLITLASRHNHVVPKGELIAAVWPDTFVSDDVLTRCISILRRITADDPQAPTFIQTVPRVGYRLLAPVRETALPDPPAGQAPAPFLTQPPAPAPLAEIPGSPLHHEPSPPPVTAQPVTSQLATHQPATVPLVPARAAVPPLGRRPLVLALTGLCLVAILAVLGGLHWAHRPNQAVSTVGHPADLHSIPFTSDVGEQSQPAFSPDGRTIALVRTAEDGSSRRICLKPIGQEVCRPLTDAPGEQFSPAWSPTGRQVAFLNRDGRRLDLLLANTTGDSTPQHVFSPEEPSDWELGALSWSPDGRSLVFPDHQAGSPSSAILLLDLATRRVRAISAPPAGWEGDLNPVFSPDGTRIAFTRASESAVRNLFWLSISDGSVHQLTHQAADINGLTWTRDGTALVFSSNRSGQFALWRIALDGGAADRLPVGTDNATQPAIGAQPGALAYTQGSAVWSIERPDGGAILTSTQEDSAPSLSPDGRFFAFQSRRSGTQQIWVASIDGASLRQLTSTNGPMAGSPSWSHTGDHILFDARPGGHSHIFSIASSGGPARQLTTGDANDIVPRWSNDDRTVFFRSNRGGRWQLWKLALTPSGTADGPPVRLTSGDGMAAQESADGTTLVFTRGDEAGLWQLDLRTGRETRLLAQPPAGFWGYLQATRDGIIVLGRSARKSELLLVDPRSGSTHPLETLLHQPPTFQGLTAMPSGSTILLTGEREAERHITLATGLPAPL